MYKLVKNSSEGRAKGKEGRPAGVAMAVSEVRGDCGKDSIETRRGRKMMVTDDTRVGQNHADNEYAE